MSTDWTKDIHEMHQKFGALDWIEANKHDKEKMAALLRFRMAFILEEYTETFKANTANDSEEIVDGLIDLCVVAIGTLDLFGVDAHRAWDEILKANMAKEAGIKPGRPNPLGLPDLMKPADWVGPTHEGNHGHLTTLE